MLLKMLSFLKSRIASVKIIFALSFLILTVYFAVPISSVVAKSGVFLLAPLTAKNLTAGNISFEEPLSDELSTDEEPEETSEKESELEETTAEVTSQEKPNAQSVYSTPTDIIELEENYLAEFASAPIYGTTEEVFFKTSGSTDSVDGIYIKNATAEKKPDFAALLEKGPELYISDKAQPSVLIFHTHTTESYLLSDNGVFYEAYETRSTDNTRNMVRVGDEICRVLEENGIGVIHDTNIYDESYDGAYSRSRVTVEKYLEEYPTIKIVLDVHRDAIYYSDTSHCKPTAEIDGKKAAQIMIITGAEEGYITSFPHWEDNLRFALSLQKTAEDMYPGLMKPLYFCQRKYNMDTAKCSLLLEIGTDANTLDEAMYSGYLTGNVLTEIINRYSEE